MIEERLGLDVTTVQQKCKCSQILLSHTKKVKSSSPTRAKTSRDSAAGAAATADAHAHTALATGRAGCGVTANAESGISLHLLALSKGSAEGHENKDGIDHINLLDKLFSCDEPK